MMIIVYLFAKKRNIGAKGQHSRAIKTKKSKINSLPAAIVCYLPPTTLPLSAPQWSCHFLLHLLLEFLL